MTSCFVPSSRNQHYIVWTNCLARRQTGTSHVPAPDDGEVVVVRRLQGPQRVLCSTPDTSAPVTLCVHVTFIQSSLCDHVRVSRSCLERVVEHVFACGLRAEGDDTVAKAGEVAHLPHPTGVSLDLAKVKGRMVTTPPARMKSITSAPTTSRS
jgi:hypothetical protein